MPELDPAKIGNLSKNLLARRLFKDKVIEIIIRFSGLLVLLAILGIFYVILDEVYPLLKKAEFNFEKETFVKLEEQSSPLALGYNKEGDYNYIWDDRGELIYFSNTDSSKKYKYKIDLPSQKLLSVVKSKNNDNFYLSDISGKVFAVEIKNTVNDNELLPKAEIFSSEQALRGLTIQESERQTLFAAFFGEAKDQIQLYGIFKGKGLISKSKSKELKAKINSQGKEFSSMEFSADGKKFFLGTTLGEVLIYDLSNFESPQLISSQVLEENTKITAMKFLIQGQTLVIGFENGNLISYMIESLENTVLLQKVHQFKNHLHSLKNIYPSMRNRMFLSTDISGAIAIHNSTAKQTQYSKKNEDGVLFDLAFSPRGNEIVTWDRKENFKSWSIDNNYSDISLKTLFTKVQYEGYKKKEYVWQSSSGSDEFEPKYNLIPLIFGTLKGTFYALLFAVPLAVMGALYVSEFMKVQYRTYIKPLVELMAAVPSVVIGFMAGIWLAPNLDDYLGSLILFPIICFSLIVASLFIYVKYYDRQMKIRKSGSEFVPVLLIVFLSVLLSLGLSGFFEDLVFSGSLAKALLENFSVIYDQRNSLVVSMAMGYAIIPLIFTLAEDSISAVPQHLREGALALGATRWQTAIKVVFPAASPGIFSAILLGFGRAIGETMIVLMATGNTPIIDLSPFNGFRALSANIAVELPEATVGGPLYRIIFLSSFLLLGFSFFVNTLTEIIRIRLRKKYN